MIRECVSHGDTYCADVTQWLTLIRECVSHGDTYCADVSDTVVDTD